MTTYNWSVEYTDLSNATLVQIWANRAEINDVAAILGVPASGIAASIAEEAQDQFDNGTVKDFLNWSLDLATIGQADHASIAANFTYLQSLPANSPTLISPGKTEKIANIGLRDVGLGNIRVVTALEMLTDYAMAGDPLDLNKYKTDYGSFVRDLVQNVDGLQAKIAGLYVELGQEFFVAKLGLPAWTLYSDEQQAELLATYYNFGEAQLEATWDANTQGGTLPYDPRPSTDDGALGATSYTQLTGILNGTFVPTLPDYGDLQEFLDVVEDADNGDPDAMAQLLEALTGVPVDASDIFVDCFPAGTLIDMWPEDVSLMKDTNGIFDQSAVREASVKKPIETITTRDRVVTFDDDGNMVPGYVDKLFENTAQDFVTLRFADGRPELVTTPGHRFLTETGDYLKIADMLRLGGGQVRLTDADGSVLLAEGHVTSYSSTTAHLFPQAQTRAIAMAGNTILQENTTQGWQTYNFEVRTHHNYVASGIRVHNDSILSQLEPGDTLLAFNDDFTDAAVLRDMDGDGTADFVTLEGYRAPDNGVFSTQLEKVRIKYWDPANGNLAALLANVVANGDDTTGNVFDPGAGNIWNDGTWGDDIEEAFFDDVLGLSGSGAQGGPNGQPPYDAVVAYVDGVAVAIPDVSGATDPISLLGALGGLIGVVDGLAPGSVTYDAGQGDVVAPPFEGITGVDAVAFLLGIDRALELIPAVTVDGPFGPIEVTPALTLGDVLDGQVGDQSQFDVVFGDGISPAQISQAQDGDNLVMTIDNGDGTTNMLTLEGVYADGDAGEIASVVFADGTTLALGDVPETVEGDGIVTGTQRDDVIDGSYTDTDGDTVSSTADVIVAGLGNDTLAGGAGNDSYDGGDGIDTVLLDGTADEFVFAFDTGLTATDTNTTSGLDEGTDTLIDIETVSFSDGSSATVTVAADTLSATTRDATGTQQARSVFDTANTRGWSDYTTTYANVSVVRVLGPRAA